MCVFVKLGAACLLGVRGVPGAEAAGAIGANRWGGETGGDHHLLGQVRGWVVLLQRAVGAIVREDDSRAVQMVLDFHLSLHGSRENRERFSLPSISV